MAAEDRKTVDWQDIQLYEGGFSVTDQLAQFVNNRQFGSGYKELQDGKVNAVSYIWYCLSAISEEVGNVIYDNVINYIDNVCNVNYCHVKALKSMLKILGTGYSLLDNIDDMPVEVVDLMDKLTINRKYLQRGLLDYERLSNVMSCYNLSVDGDLVTQSEMKEQGKELSDITVGYNMFLYDSYYSLLSSQIYLTYNDHAKTYVYKNISADLIEAMSNDSTESYQITNLKKKNRIANSFDQVAIADNIENGLDVLSNYFGAEQAIIKIELDNRTSAFVEDEMQTRYAYYRDKKVKEYFSFIENQYDMLENLMSNAQIYDIDTNYFVLHNKNKVKTFLLNQASGEKEYTIKTHIIEDVAKLLVQVNNKIIRLREKIKVQGQKNYMKGTFLLISYLVSEYLRENLAEIKTFSSISADLCNAKVNAIEYYDTTEYFNLSASTSHLSRYKKGLNPRYWEPSTKSSNMYILSANEIEDFYLDILNMRGTTNGVDPDNEELYDFLSTIYDLGADKSYIGIDGNPVYGDTSDAAVSAYNRDIFLKYNGNDIGWTPYYNIKNTVHSSHQLHPYLSAFVKYTKVYKAIKNSFYNDINDNYMDQIIQYKVDTYIGEFGNTQNIWKGNLHDYSGYQTRYEASSHDNEKDIGVICPVIDYDGAFYPPALEDYLADPAEFISQVSALSGDYYKKYYSHLQLNVKQGKRVAKQLSAYYDYILDVAKPKSKPEEMYDIYKYGIDIYQNNFVLYKKYSSVKPTYTEKKNTPGELWIRLKDHPIAFPAFWGECPQATFDDDDKLNGQIPVLGGGIAALTSSTFYEGQAHHFIDEEVEDPYTHQTVIRRKIISTPDGTDFMRVFFDMEFSQARNVLMMNAIPVEEDYDDDGNKYWAKIDNPSYANSDIVVFNVIQEYDTSDRYVKFYMGFDTVTREDKIERPSGYSLTGFYRDSLAIGAVYYKMFPAQSAIDVKCIQYIQGLMFYDDRDSTQVVVDSRYEMEEDAEMALAFYDGTFTLVFMAKEPLTVARSYIAEQNSTTGFVRDFPDAALDPIYPDQKNSLDAFKHYIGVVDFSTGNVGTYSVKYYNLNVDASFVPNYPGEDGKVHLYKSKFYYDKELNSLELLGYAKQDMDDLIAKKKTLIFNEEDENGDVVDPVELQKKAFGRVWEDYDEALNNSALLKKSSPAFPIRDLIVDDSDPDNVKKYYEWDISLSSLRHDVLSDYNVALFNSTTDYKNPIYFCKLTDIRDGVVSGFYYNDQDSELDKIFLEETGTSTDSVEVVGASAFGTVAAQSGYLGYDNHFFNIGKIEAECDFDAPGELRFKFYLSHPEYESIIEHDKMLLYVYNTHDLTIYEKHHYLDPTGKYKDTYDFERYPLNNFKELSTVPWLSGESLAFKFDEQSYLEKLKMTYPRLDLEFMDFSAEAIALDELVNDTQLFENCFDLSNTFVFQPNSSLLSGEHSERVIDKINQVTIPIKSKDYGTAMVDESFISCQMDYKVDETDIEMMQYLKAFDLSAYSKYNIYPIPEPSEGIALSTFQAQLADEHGVYTAVTEDEYSITTKDHIKYRPTSEEIEKYLNIYVNYFKNGDDIVLYFNYNNFFNSPFVYQNERTGRFFTKYYDTSYLCLKPGDDGTLDIVIQFKYFDRNRSLKGIATSVVYSYRIWNVSDDKPKFVIRKQSEMFRNAYGYTDATCYKCLSSHCQYYGQICRIADVRQCPYFGSGLYFEDNTSKSTSIVIEQKELKLGINALDSSSRLKTDYHFTTHMMIVCPYQIGTFESLVFIDELANGLVLEDIYNASYTQTGCYVRLTSKKSNRKDVYFSFKLPAGTQFDSSTHSKTVAIDILDGNVLDNRGQKIPAKTFASYLKFTCK